MAVKKLLFSTYVKRYPKCVNRDRIESYWAYIDTLVGPEKERYRLDLLQTLYTLSMAEMKSSATPTTIDLNKLVVKPEVFNGRNPKPRTWIETYNDAISANGWSNLIAIKYFRTFVTGPAADWFTVEIRPKLDQFKEWKEVDALFRANYLGRAETDALAKELELTRQHYEESVSTFIPRARRLMLQVNPTISEQEQLRVLMTKLKPELQERLTEFNNKDIRELRDNCLRLEAGLNLKRQHNTNRQGPPKQNMRSYNTNFNPASPKVRNFTNVIKPKPSTIGNTQTGPPQRNIGPKSSDRKATRVTSHDKNCYRCGRNNHWAAECRAKYHLNGKVIQRAPTVNYVPVTRQGNFEELVEEVNASQPVSVQRKVNTLTESPKRTLITRPLICNGCDVKALIDTGAFPTIVNEDLAISKGWKISTKESINLQGPNKSKIPVKGYTILNLEMELNKVTKMVKTIAWVVENLDSPIILGIQIMSVLKIVVDTETQTLYFKDTEERSKGSVTVSEETLLPPRTGKILTANVNHDGLIMIKPTLNENGLMVANSIGKASNCAIELLVANTTSKSMRLKEGSSLACYEPADEQRNDDSKTIITSELNKIKLGDNLTQEQRTELKQLLKENVKAFSIQGELGLTNVVKHRIELEPDSKPVVEPLRRRALTQVEETRKQVKHLLETGIIEESESPWASAYVLAKKKNGDYRLCIDFRRLNDQTKKMVYPLPNVEDCLDTLSGKSYFSQIDFASGFWQIEMDENSKELTAFRTEDGQFQFRRMPFGLTNAPATFQKMINAVLAGMRGMNLQLFIDDVCIATHTWLEHTKMLSKLFKLVIEANLKIQPSKCVFGADSIIFLGHEISAEGIRQDPSKLAALKNIPRPNNAQEVKRIHGMFSYYRKFVPNFAILSEPLTRLTRKNVEFSWNEEQEKSFQTLIQKLLANATLSHFDHKAPTRVKTDSSRKGVAGILQQDHGNGWKIITCCSRRLSASEMNYGITDLEGLAIVYTLGRLRPYLLGKKFDLLTDHCALCVLKTRISNSPRIRRWSIILSEFDFNIVYVKGGLHEDADCLSRIPMDGEEDELPNAKIYNLIEPLNNEIWINSYTDEDSIIIDQAANNLGGYVLKDNIVYHKDQLYIPSAKRINIIKEAHTTCGHGGTVATMNKLKNTYWPKMQSDINQFVKSCHVCQQRKVPREKPSGSMYHFEIYRPMQVVAMDILGSLTLSSHDNKYLIVSIDMFTRYIHAKPIPNLLGVTIAQYIDEYIRTYGNPKAILSDKGPEFYNNAVGNILNRHKVERRFSTPDHSQGNSIIERAIQTLQEKLSIITVDKHGEGNENQWEDVLTEAIQSINSTTHTTTNYTPHMLFYGRENNRQSTEIDTDISLYDQYKEMVTNGLTVAQCLAIENQDNAQKSSTPSYESSHNKVTYKPGDFVMARLLGKRANTKLGPRYQGPFEVVSRDNDVYYIRLISTGKLYQRHVMSLKRYNMPNWAYSIFMLSILVISLAQSICATPYSKAKNILYLKDDDHYVDVGRIDYDISLIVTDPCDLLRNLLVNIKPSQEAVATAPTFNAAEQLTSLHEQGVQMMNDCSKFFEETILQYWKLRMKNLDTVRPDYHGIPEDSNMRKKRSAIRAKRACRKQFGRPCYEWTSTKYNLREAMRALKILGWHDNDIEAWSRFGEFLYPDYKDEVRTKIVEPVTDIDDYLELDRTKRATSCETSDEKNISEILEDTSYDKGLEDEKYFEVDYNKTHITVRRKRGVVAGIVVSLASTFIGNVVTNFLGTAIEYINPGSQYNRLNSIEKQVSAFKENFDILKHITENMVDSLQIRDNSIREKLREVERKTMTKSKFDLIERVIRERIMSARELFEDIFDDFNFGKVNVKAMTKLLDFRKFEEFTINTNEDTEFMGIMSSKNTLRFQFSTRRRSKDTHVYRVYGFTHWANLTGTPKLLEYAGKEHMVYNETSHCIKSITKPILRPVNEVCSENNYDDPLLGDWKTVYEGDDFFAPGVKPNLFTTLRNYYLYCFPYNVTIKDVNYRCPPHVINILPKYGFTTLNHRMLPSKLITENISVDWRLASEDIHVGHYANNDEPNDDWEYLDALRNNRELLSKIQSKIESNHVMSPFVFSLLMGIISASIIFNIGIILWVFWFKNEPDTPYYISPTDVYSQTTLPPSIRANVSRVRFSRSPSNVTAKSSKSRSNSSFRSALSIREEALNQQSEPNPEEISLKDNPAVFTP